MKTNHALHIQKLCKKFDNETAVDHISFHVEPGEIFALLGPNGSGKTTTISMIATLLQPSSGYIAVNGVELQKNPRLAKSFLGLVPQEAVSHGFFTVEEVLHFTSGYQGVSQNAKHIEYLLKKLALWDHRNKRVAQLSGGMKRRLLIAKALVHKPKLLLLDEPTAGVDIELRNTLWQFVREINDLGVTILLTTHYLQEAEELCNRVGILSQGKLIRVDQTKTLIRELTMRVVKVELAQSAPDLKHPYLQKHYDNILQFSIPSHMHVGALLSEMNLPLSQIIDLQIREGSLEEAFLKLVNSHGVSV